MYLYEYVYAYLHAMQHNRNFYLSFFPTNTATNIPSLTVTAGSPVMVPKGNSFQVECNVPADINYCWLRHPNGTTVPVTVPSGGSAGHKTSRYRYAGEGLSFGQCHVTVTDASTSDTGVWLCALGLRDDRHEMYGMVNVTVSGTIVQALILEPFYQKTRLNRIRNLEKVLSFFS